MERGEIRFVKDIVLLVPALQVLLYSDFIMILLILISALLYYLHIYVKLRSVVKFC